MASEGSVPSPPSELQNPLTGMGRVLGMGMGKWGDGDGVKERNGSKRNGVGIRKEIGLRSRQGEKGDEVGDGKQDEKE